MRILPVFLLSSRLPDPSKAKSASATLTIHEVSNAYSDTNSLELVALALDCVLVNSGMVMREGL